MPRPLPPTFETCNRPTELYRVCEVERYDSREGIFARSHVDPETNPRISLSTYLENHSNWYSTLKGPFISVSSDPLHALKMYDTYLDNRNSQGGYGPEEICILKISGDITQYARSVKDLVKATGVKWQGAGKRLAESEYLFLWHIPATTIVKITKRDLLKISERYI
ncbi:hypothetical protein RQP46_001587 [Phenoliferia psychrophenolica]